LFQGSKAKKLKRSATPVDFQESVKTTIKFSEEVALVEYSLSRWERKYPSQR
jgi:hypothetical protein